MSKLFDWQIAYLYKHITLYDCLKYTFSRLNSSMPSMYLLPVEIIDYCKAYPNAVLPDPDDCSRYYQCRLVTSSATSSHQQCTYPDLFSPSQSRCVQFDAVQCGNRPEPTAPCKYMRTFHCLLVEDVKFQYGKSYSDNLLSENAVIYTVFTCIIIICFLSTQLIHAVCYPFKGV